MSGLAIGDLGIDFSGARPTPEAIKKAGAKFVVRYSAGAASATSHPSHDSIVWKLITPKEFKSYVDAGIDVIANDEWYESRIAEGAKAGREDGAAALAHWKSCGYGKGASIYSSWDTAPIPSKWDDVAAYLAAYETALAGYYHVDCYAGTPALRAFLNRHRIRYGWRPNAGSWSNDGLPYQPDTGSAAKRSNLVSLAQHSTPAHVWQTGNYWWNKSADENLILRLPVGSHFEATATNEKPPTPKPDPTPKPVPPGDLYPVPDGASRQIVSDNREWSLTVHDDGRVSLRRGGQHEHDLYRPGS